MKIKFYKTENLTIDLLNMIEHHSLYCYDLRISENLESITIEKNVLINRIGKIVTNVNLDIKDNEFMNYDSFLSNAIEVLKIQELIK